mgnify:CR=1 FL=1
MRRWIWVLITILLIGSVSPVWAAGARVKKKTRGTAAAVMPRFPWNSMFLRWQTDGPIDPSVTEYFLECDHADGVFKAAKRYSPSVPNVAMRGFLPAMGAWTCHVSALAGEVVMARSPDYPFVLYADLILIGFVKSG